MLHTFARLNTAAWTLCALSSLATVAAAAAPSVDQALKLTPTQNNVDYDDPAPAEVAKCTIKAEKIGSETGWVVRNAGNQVLREFVDTNNDNVVDRWSYFKDGIEIYRDIDENYNGKAEQYRWLNTAGGRWAVDRDEDGKIDAWKQISPEEVSAEVVVALRDRDPHRFELVLLSPAEAKTLGLGTGRLKALTDRVIAAPSTFNELARKQRTLTPKTDWIHFGGTRPGTIPAGTDGSTGDVTAYENVVAMVDTDGKDGQVQIGTIIKVGDLWRVIDAPTLPDPNTKLADAAGFFFNATYRGPETPGTETAPGGPSEALQKKMEVLAKLDEAVTQANTETQLTQLNEQRADLLMQIVDEVDEKDRPQWLRQFADTVGAAAQSGKYPGGVDRLKELVSKLEANPQDGAQMPYVKFRYLQADYGSKLQRRDIDFAKVQSEWLENLEKYVTDYPQAPDSAEALLQLGIAQEFAGQEDKAKKWYGDLVANFDGTPSAAKARGALTRLNSVGEVMTLRGKTTTGQVDDLAKYKGKHVLIHYWATWCEPCKTDLAQLKELYARFGKNGFTLIGVSLDNNSGELTGYLAKNRLPWNQLFEQGGLDSRLANEMGVLTLPTMILVDDQGKVVNRNIHITELESELKSRLKEAPEEPKAIEPPAEPRVQQQPRPQQTRPDPRDARREPPRR